MTSYTPTGPFTDASAPGVSSAFLNALEQYLGYAANTLITAPSDGTLQLAKSPTTFNGNVGGTASCYTPIWGSSLKLLVITCGSYNSTGTPSFALPTSLARGIAFFGDPNSSGLTFGMNNGGGGISWTIITGLAGGGGSSTTGTSLFRNSIATVPLTISNVVLGSTSSASQGTFVLIGT